MPAIFVGILFHLFGSALTAARQWTVLVRRGFLDINVRTPTRRREEREKGS